MSSGVKHILVVIRYPVGGIRTYIRYIYSNESFSGFFFTFVVPDESLKPYFDQIFKQNSYRLVVCGASTKELFFSANRCLRQQQYDLVHSHGFTSGIVAAFASRMNRVKHIMTTHDVLQSSQFLGFKGEIKKFIIGSIFRLTDKIMAVGDDAKNNLISFFPFLDSHGKVVAIQNGIDIHGFSKTGKRDLKAELVLKDESFLLGFFGRFMSQKGFKYLVAAVKELEESSSLDIHVVCFGWGGFIREEQREIKKLGLEHCFHFMDHTDDMSSAIRGVDLVVLPSLWEACPLLPMEVLVTGTPLITTQCIGMKEVVEDTPVITFEKANAQSLVAAILNVKNNYEGYSRDIIQYQEKAKSRFDANVSAKKLYSLYIELLH